MQTESVVPFSCQRFYRGICGFGLNMHRLGKPLAEHCLGSSQVFTGTMAETQMSSSFWRTKCFNFLCSSARFNNHNDLKTIQIP